MAKTSSTMLPLNTPMPEFALPSTDDILISSSDFLGKAVLVMFICNHCPYVTHVLPELVKLSGDFKWRGLDMVGINSNDVNKYPDDDPSKMKILIKQLSLSRLASEGNAIYRGRPFLYLFDETQEVAKKFHAACTPDFYLFDEKGLLVYRGRLDSSTPGNGEVLNGSELRSAIEATLGGFSVSADQKASVGCNIKWK